ncbi:MAG: hypothetical protein WBA17_12525 [Saprospiraceae bacterium]
MRYALLFLLLAGFGLGTQLSAQQQTLLRKARFTGAFGAPIYEFALSDGLADAAGGGGGLVFNNVFIGGYGMKTRELAPFQTLNADLTSAELRQGGFWLGFTGNSDKLIHPYGSVRAGWGRFDYREDGRGDVIEDRNFAATPELGLELNVATWFRINAAAGYRYVNGLEDNAPLTDDQLSGFTANLTLRFGIFGSTKNRWGRRDWD